MLRRPSSGDLRIIGHFTGRIFLAFAGGEFSGLVEQAVDQVPGSLVHSGDVEAIDDRCAVDGE